MHLSPNRSELPRRPAAVCAVLIAAAVLLAFALMNPAAAAPQDGQKFQNWTVRCEADRRDPAVKRCFIFQGIVAGEGKKRIMMVVVAYPVGQNQPRLTAVLPLGVDLRPGVELTVDAGAGKRYPFAFCLPDGCQAHAPMDDALLGSFKRGVEGSVAFRRLPDGRGLKVPFSLRGFTAALNSLK